MEKHLRYQVHVALNLHGATPEDLQLALREAYEQLAQGIPESNTVLQSQKAGFTFKVTALDLDNAKPAPAVPPFR